jgi:DNA invertase Pin-like site-specific DNA recombinase
MDRNGWKNLMARVRPGDTVVVAFLDRFSRNFKEGVAIQADLTKRDIAIVALREQIDTREDSAAAKFFRRAMLAQGAYQVESASARIRMGLERARAGGKSIGRPPAPSAEQVEQCRPMAEEGASKRQIARVLSCSPSTVKKALASFEAGMEVQR